MRNAARLSAQDRSDLFRNTADKMGLSDAIVEKDFWVCFTLDYLFHRSLWKEAITFKGGTSLSKCFDLIHRFSEDIDLILDWRLVGCGKDEPWAERSKNQQDKFNKAVNARTEAFLAEEFLPKLEADFCSLLNDGFQSGRFIPVQGDGLLLDVDLDAVRHLVLNALHQRLGLSHRHILERLAVDVDVIGEGTVGTCT